MLMVKRYIRIGIVILIRLLAVSTYTLYNRNQDLKEEISVSLLVVLLMVYMIGLLFTQY